MKRGAMEDWETIGGKYKKAAEASKACTEHPFVEEFLKSCLEKLNGNPAKVLDAGCGCGKYTQLALDVGYRRVLALDVAASMAKQAEDTINDMVKTRGWQEECTVDVKECSVLDMTSQVPGHVGTCDVAICVWVLCNLPDLETVRSSLQQLTAMMTPGGRLLLLEAHPMNHTDISSDAFVRDMRGNDGYFSGEGQPFEICLPLGDGGRISFQNRRYTLATWLNLLVECGLRIESAQEPRFPGAQEPVSLVLCCTKC